MVKIIDHVNDVNGAEEIQNEEILFALHQETNNEHDDISWNFVINQINISEVFETNNIYMRYEDIHVE